MVLIVAKHNKVLGYPTEIFDFVLGDGSYYGVTRFRGTRPQSMIALTGRGSYYSLFTRLDTNPNCVDWRMILLKGVKI